MTSMFFSPNDWQSVTARLSLALVVGFAIGINRQRTGRPAGLRTFMIVSLGSALFVMLPLQNEIADQLTDATASSEVARSTALNAMARVAQGVATGVGFLGGGVILQQRHPSLDRTEVKGLTTAAAIWLAGGLGAAAGCGLWQLSVIGTLMTLFVLGGVKKLKQFEWRNWLE
nr:MgtC/SapB family protein [Leptolyngbya sp. FACHB-671]